METGPTAPALKLEVVPAPDRIGPRRLVVVLQRGQLTARRAAAIIAAFTLIVTLAGGVIARLADPGDFPSIGDALWWSLQTATTVGYGDVVPHAGGGRWVGAIVMVTGIAFVTVITAAVTAALIETGRRRAGGTSNDELAARLEKVSDRLSAIEAHLGASRGPGEGPPG